jgi:ferritin-like metal-binding protein YciE
MKRRRITQEELKQAVDEIINSTEEEVQELPELVEDEVRKIRRMR